MHIIILEVWQYEENRTVLQTVQHNKSSGHSRCFYFFFTSYVPKIPVWCCLVVSYNQDASKKHINLWNMSIIAGQFSTKSECEWVFMSSGMWHCVTGWLLLGILNEHSVFILKGEVVHKNVLESWNFLIWNFMKISSINPKLQHADKHSKGKSTLCILFVVPVAKNCTTVPICYRILWW